MEEKNNNYVLSILLILLYFAFVGISPAFGEKIIEEETNGEIETTIIENYDSSSNGEDNLKENSELETTEIENYDLSSNKEDSLEENSIDNNEQEIHISGTFYELDINESLVDENTYNNVINNNVQMKNKVNLEDDIYEIQEGKLIIYNYEKNYRFDNLDSIKYIDAEFNVQDGTRYIYALTENNTLYFIPSTNVNVDNNEAKIIKYNINNIKDFYIKNESDDQTTWFSNVFIRTNDGKVFRDNISFSKECYNNLENKDCNKLIEIVSK